MKFKPFGFMSVRVHESFDIFKEVTDSGIQNQFKKDGIVMASL